MEVELRWLLTAPSRFGRYRVNSNFEAHKKAGLKERFSNLLFFTHCISLYLNVFIFDSKQHQFYNILGTCFFH